MKAIKKFRNDYVIKQVQNAKIPEFPEDEIVRMKFYFSGRVQKVGFRLEISELSKRLGLTGFARNLPNKDVEVELQGQRNKIDFVVSFMQSLKRIKIVKLQCEEMELKEEHVFSIDIF